LSASGPISIRHLCLHLHCPCDSFSFLKVYETNSFLLLQTSLCAFISVVIFTVVCYFPKSERVIQNSNHSILQLLFSPREGFPPETTLLVNGQAQTICKRRLNRMVTSADLDFVISRGGRGNCCMDVDHRAFSRHLLLLPLIKATQLYQAKSNAYFGETRDRISRLFRLTVQTGFLTAILAVPISPLYMVTTVQVTNAFTIPYVDRLYRHVLFVTFEFTPC
jgi:hypothetical protein